MIKIKVIKGHVDILKEGHRPVVLSEAVVLIKNLLESFSEDDLAIIDETLREITDEQI